MSTETSLAGITDLMKPWTVAVRQAGPNGWDIDTRVEDILPAVSALSGARWGFLSAITGLVPCTCVEKSVLPMPATSLTLMVLRELAAMVNEPCGSGPSGVMYVMLTSHGAAFGFCTST